MAIIRVHIPVLTDEEREKRLEEVKKVASTLLKSIPEGSSYEPPLKKEKQEEDIYIIDYFYEDEK